MCEKSYLEQISEIIATNQVRVEEYLFENNNIESHILNHMWRIFLQSGNENCIKRVFNEMKARQLKDGGWGYADSEQSILGITATVVQLLFWSKHILSADKQLCNEIDASVEKSIRYILKNGSKYDFWEEPSESNLKRKHGLIDVNHYIAQIFFYYLQEHENKEMLDKYQLLCNWYISLQCADGGWHELDKVRSRIGTTADAVRALLPNKTYSAFIMKGTDFLVNNQNIYSGYWANGNRDKCFDALKTLLASSSILNMKGRYYESICLGTKYLLTLDIENMDFEEMCDILSIYIDIYSCFLNSDEKKKFF